MTIAGACRPPTRDYAGGWHAAGGLLSTLLGARDRASGKVVTDNLQGFAGGRIVLNAPSVVAVAGVRWRECQTPTEGTTNPWSEQPSPSCSSSSSLPYATGKTTRHPLPEPAHSPLPQPGLPQPTQIDSSSL